MFNFHTHTKAKRAIINIDSVSTYNLAPGFYYSLGSHPWFKKQAIEDLENLIHQNPQIIAIGECGLDKLKSEYTLEVQLENLTEQINLSEKLKLPLILHIVKGFNEIIKLKKELEPKQNWIIHGFNKYKQMESLVNAGIYLSFGKSLLFNKQLQRSFMDVPIQNIFLETDDSSIKIEKLYNFASTLKQIDKHQLITQIRKNLTIVTHGKLAR